MVVRPRLSFFGMFGVLRGSILPHVAPQIATITLLSVGVVILQRQYPGWFISITPTPFTLLGLALSIFLSFRNSACYDRWWEGRKHWGQLILEMRGFARLITSLFPGENERTFRIHCLRLAVGFAHGLNARLRGENELAAVTGWFGAQNPVNAPNIPDAALLAITSALAQRYRKGELSDILFQTIEARLESMGAIQAACERIRNTPLPFGYTLLLHRTAYLFCGLVPFGIAGSLGWFTPLLAAIIAYTFFGLDALGSELEEPFGRALNDLPLDAMVRTIEIDLLPAAGEAVPPPLEPVRFILS